MNLSRFFIERPVFTSVLSIVVVLAGLMALRILPVEQYPSIVPPQISVVASYPGASSETVAKTVAAPLEEAINGVSDMLYIHSTSSSSGQMRMTVTFAIGTDPDEATINVNNRVQRALTQLPDAVRRTGVDVRKRSSNILELVMLYSPGQSYGPTYMSNYALVHLINEIKRVPGVGQARLFGRLNYSIRVWLKPDKMARYKVTASDVESAISAQNAQFGAGSLSAAPGSDSPKTFKITGVGRFSDVKQFKNILLHVLPDGSALRLKDVARVELGQERYAFRGRFNNTPTVPIGIFLEPGANALSTTTAVQKRVAELAGSFPAGMKYKVPFTTTEFVRDSIHEVAVTFIESILLVMAVIFLFLQNWRAALIPVLAIPVSLIGTFAGMYALGFSINLLTLFGMILAIGLVVDDAIVVIENVERIMSEEGLPPFKAALKAMSEVSEPILAIALVMAMVFIPVGFLGGLTGQLYRQFAITIAMSMGLSAFVALTLSPMLCALLIKPRKTEPMAVFRWFNAGFSKVTTGYLWGVDFLLRHAVFGVVLFAIFCAGTYLLFRIVPNGLVPQEDQGYVVVTTSLQAGATLQRTDRFNSAVIKKILQRKPVQGVISFAGFDLLSSAEVPNAGAAFINLKDWSKRKESAEDFVDTVEDIGDKTEGGKVVAFNPPPITGMSTTGGFTAYLQATGGQTPQEIQKMAKKLVDKAKGRPELGDARTTIETDYPVYKVHIDRDKARSMGIPISKITQTMASTYGQSFVNQFTMLNRNYRVIVQSAAQYRQTPDDLSKLYVRATRGSSEGRMVPLSSLVSMHRAQAPNIVTRFDVFPAAKLMGKPADGYTSGQAIEAMKEVAGQVLPQEYRISWSGQAYQEQKVGTASMMAFGFGLIMVFLILAAQYERWTLPLAVVTAVPFALFGAIVAVLLRGLASDVYFQVGLLVLIGLAAKNAILIVEYAVDLRDEGETLINATRHAARLRFRPIIMTSVAFIVGSLPLALASGASSASRHSIGTAVVGGMLGATILAIFFVPLFHVLITRAGEWRSRKKG